MDNLTRIIREEIGKQYKSVRQFAFAVGVPLSTVNSALHNGVGGSSFDTVLRLCKVLGIKALGDDAAFYLTDDTEKLLTQYARLDDYGRHTISAVMQVEYDRCTELSKPDLEEHSSVNIRTSRNVQKKPAEGQNQAAGLRLPQKGYALLGQNQESLRPALFRP